MATIFGAAVVKELGNASNIQYDVIGANSVVFAKGDVVFVQGGSLAVIGLNYTGVNDTRAIIGVAVKAQTMAATNAGTAKVTPGYIPADPTTIFLMGTNSDLISNNSDYGKYYALTGATGAIQVDVGAGVQPQTSRMVMIVKVDPFGDGGSGSGSGLRKCYVRFMKTPYNNVAVTTP